MGQENANSASEQVPTGAGAGMPQAPTRGGEDRAFDGGRGKNQDQRIDTDGDGRTRDRGDTRATNDGGRGAPVQR